MKSVNKECFGTRLNQLMQAHNYTMRTLGEAVQLNSSTIFRYIHGQIAPKVTTIAAFARLFGVNPTWLMGYDVPMFLSEQAEQAASLSQQYLLLTPSQQEQIQQLLCCFLRENKKS